MRLSFAAVPALVALLATAPAIETRAAGNLAGQEPITVTVELGKGSEHAFVPNKLRFETGKLYKLVLSNQSQAPHYFTSNGFSPGRSDSSRAAMPARCGAAQLVASSPANGPR